MFLIGSGKVYNFGLYAAYQVFTGTAGTCQLNKLMSVFYASVLLLMINCVITLSKWLWNHEPQGGGSAANFDNVMMNVMLNKRTDA